MATTAGLAIERISREYFAAWEACDPDRIAGLHAPASRFQLHAGGEAAEGRAAVRQACARPTLLHLALETVGGEGRGDRVAGS